MFSFVASCLLLAIFSAGCSGKDCYGPGDGCQPCGQCYSGTCNSTGHCSSGCKAHFKLPLCIECEDGWWNDKCSAKCGRCWNPTKSCNKSNGHCKSCIFGLLPPLCTEDCPKGYYGPNCNKSCGKCWRQNAKLSCDPVSGKCPGTPGRPRRCLDGFIGSNCETQCPFGTAGPDCVHLCGNCKDNECDAEGNCTRGCSAGFFGHKCENGGHMVFKEYVIGHFAIMSYHVAPLPCWQLGNVVLAGVLLFYVLLGKIVVLGSSAALSVSGGSVGCCALILILGVIFLMVRACGKNRRRKHALLTMHHIQKKLSDQARFVDPETDLDTASICPTNPEAEPSQPRFKARSNTCPDVTQAVETSSSEDVKLPVTVTKSYPGPSSPTVPISRLPPPPLLPVQDPLPPITSEDTRMSRASTNSNYVTAVSSPGVAPYDDMTFSHNSYNPRGCSQASEREPVYVNEREIMKVRNMKKIFESTDE